MYCGSVSDLHFPHDSQQMIMGPERCRD